MGSSLSFNLFIVGKKRDRFMIFPEALARSETLTTFELGLSTHFPPTITVTHEITGIIFFLAKNTFIDTLSTNKWNISFFRLAILIKNQLIYVNSFSIYFTIKCQSDLMRLITFVIYSSVTEVTGLPERGSSTSSRHEFGIEPDLNGSVLHISVPLSWSLTQKLITRWNVTYLTKPTRNNLTILSVPVCLYVLVCTHVSTNAHLYTQTEIITVLLYMYRHLMISKCIRLYTHNHTRLIDG